MKRKGNILLLATVGLLTLPIGAKAITPALTHLEVETKQGTGNFQLSGGKTSFNFGLSSSLGYANIIATPANENYKVTGAGKVKCTDGVNKISVVVTDPSDNSSVTYTINLNYTTKTGTTEKGLGDVSNNSNNPENPKTGAFMNEAVLAAGGLSSILLIKKGSNKKKFNKI